MRFTLLVSILLCASVPFILSGPLAAQVKDTLYVDNLDPGYSEGGGTWLNSAAAWGSESRVTIIGGVYGQWARWNIDVPNTGYYATYYIIPATANGRVGARYTVHPFGVDEEVQYRNQNDNSGDWNILGVYNFATGADQWVEVYNDSLSLSGYSLRADAIRLITSLPDQQDIETERRQLYNYGEVAMGIPKDWTFKVWNIGGAPLTVSDLATSDGIFSATQPQVPFDIPPRSAVEVTLQFNPNFEKTFDDTLSIVSNDADEPVIRIPVRGVGTTMSVIVNDEDGFPFYMEHVGSWVNSSPMNIEGYQNLRSRMVIRSTDVGATAEFVPDIPVSGLYTIYYGGPNTTNGADHALIEVRPFGGAIDSVYINQNGPDWKKVGTYYLFEGTNSSVFQINDGSGGGYAYRVDLLKFSHVPSIADIHLDVTSYTFVDVPISGSETWDFKIENIGNADLVVGDIHTSTPNFQITSPSSFPIIIPALDSTVATVEFSPEIYMPFHRRARH